MSLARTLLIFTAAISIALSTGWLLWLGASVRGLYNAGAGIVDFEGSKYYPPTTGVTGSSETGTDLNRVLDIYGGEAMAEPFAEMHHEWRDFGKWSSTLETPLKIAGMRQLFATDSMERALDLLEKASKSGGAQFARDYSLGWDMDPGPMPHIVAVSRAWAARAWLKGRDGLTASAARDFANGIRLGRIGINDTILMGWMSGVRIGETVFYGSQAAISSTDAAEFSMDDWAPLLDESLVTESIIRSRLAEILEFETDVGGGWMFRGILLGRLGEQEIYGGDADLLDSAYLVLARTLLLPALISEYRSYLYYMASLRQRVVLGSTTDQEAGTHRLESKAGSFRMAAIAARGMDRIPVLLDCHVAQLRLLQAGLRLEHYRQRQGKYPDSLSDLHDLGQSFIDPFTGDFFRYKSTGDGVLLYSTGPDLIDGGGRNKNGFGGDIVWRIRRVAQ